MARNPFMMMQENRDGRNGRENDEMLPEDNKSIRELTEVFKPLPLVVYLKTQNTLSKQIDA